MPDSQQTSTSKLTKTKMPPLGRFPSFSKRHASFNSPREVPLPSPLLNQSEAQNSYFASRVSTTPPVSPTTERRPKSPSGSPVRHRATESSSSKRSPPQDSTPQPAPYTPSRPMSIPESQSTSYSSTLSNYLRQQPPTPPHTLLSQSPEQSKNDGLRSTTWLDRNSSASLPLPSQVPFYALPRMKERERAQAQQQEGGSSLGGGGYAQKHAHPSMQGDREASSTSTADRPALCCPSINGSNSSGSSITSSNSSSSSVSGSSGSSATSTPEFEQPSSMPMEMDKATLQPSTTSTSTRPTHGRTQTERPQRPISPFRAPRPPTPEPQPEPSYSNPYPRGIGRIPEFTVTAMRRYMTPSQISHLAQLSHLHLQPAIPVPDQEVDPETIPEPDPPTILDSPPLPAADAGASTSPSTTRSAPSLSSSSTSGSSAPYANFLSRAPAPSNCHLEIETFPHSYRLNVGLPGFEREGITLSTKRRRILSVVADKWDEGGGHFERRISFGYDADLTQVRAEFDGSLLRINIPRRVAPVFLR